jgi:anthranilate synthase/aminodeoxychorismate synthase-like glutamine amidotransferase
MILVIDNYDSFVHNLARHFRLLGCQTKVVRNDGISVDEISQLSPSAIVLSPGPCSPDEAGICLDAVRAFQKSKPILGVCLGHQTIIQAFGGEIVTANEPMHGRSSSVNHNGAQLFDKISDPFTAGRYHSLVGQPKSLPADLRATAKTSDQTIMAVEHESKPVFGLQFHPESVLTDCGFRLISNFLTAAKIKHKSREVDSLQAKQLNGSQAGSPPYSISKRLSTRPDKN